MLFVTAAATRPVITKTNLSLTAEAGGQEEEEERCCCWRRRE